MTAQSDPISDRLVELIDRGFQFLHPTNAEGQVQAVVGVGELALVNQEPDIHPASVHGGLDLIERHDHRFEVGLVEPEREIGRGEQAGHGDALAAQD